MKIDTYGEVVLKQDIIEINGFRMSRDSTDNPEVSDEQLLLYTAVEWALKRLTAEVDRARFDALTRFVAEAKAARARESN